MPRAGHAARPDQSDSYLVQLRLLQSPPANSLAPENTTQSPLQEPVPFHHSQFTIPTPLLTNACSIPHSRTYEPTQAPKNKPKRKGPPTLAGIVRNKTNHGKVIVDFYLDVVQGNLDHEGFDVCHRIEAAEQLHAIAPGLVAEYLSKLTGMECSHAIKLKRTRDLDCRARQERAPLSTHDTPHARHEALEYLASALAAPSLADDHRVAGIVRASTDHGKTVVSYLLHVMYGTVRGFTPRNRVQAACELLGHIARDELSRSGALAPSPSTSLTPSPSTGEGWGEGDSPAKAGIQSDVAVVPAKAGFLPQEPSPTQRSGDREGLPSKATEPKSEPKAVRPELVEEPALSLPKGQFSAKSAVPSPVEADDDDDTDEPDHRGTYDINEKLTEAQHDPAHPVHKFVEAYEEVAATFRRQDEENDNDEDVRKWISGEVPDARGKYISDYAPAIPRADRLLKAAKRQARRRRSTPKAESIWGPPMTADRMRREGTYPPRKRNLIWL